MKRIKIKHLLNIFILLALILTLGLLAYVAVQLPTEGTQCLLDPLIYGAKEIEKANNANVFCSCTLAKRNSPTLHFNAENKSIEKIFSIPNRKPIVFINVTELIENFTIN